VGTGGTVIGLGAGLRERVEDVTVVGAMCASGEEIPGVRDLERMKEITLPWQDALSDCIEVEARVSYLSSLWFNWAEGLTPGLSGGLTYVAALKFLKKRKDEGTLDALRSKDGKIQTVIVFHDGWRPYLVDRFPMLPTDYQSPTTAPKPWELLWE
jgi:cysteine synthase